MAVRARQAKPAGLALVEAFVNTNHIEARYEELTTPARVRAWLVARDLLAGDVAVREADRRRAVAVREALRVLLLSNSGVAIDPTAVDPLNQFAAAVPWQAHVTPDGQARLIPTATGVDGALAQIVVQVVVAMLDGRWSRLKACRADPCHWAFFDHSRNQSRVWCTMRTCGSRNKARAYQRRRRARAS